MGFKDKVNLFFTLCRGYSLPISIMSWVVPFLFAFLNGGNVFYGLIALFGIVILHLATNLFDDVVDYVIEYNKIKKGLKNDFNFQKGKCSLIINKEVSLKTAFAVSVLLFFIAGLTGLYFIGIYGFKLLYIIIPSAFIFLLYPILGSMGFGEVLVAIAFSPLLYSGVYFVMTGGFSYDILAISISTGLFVVAVLHNHMLLDYKYDKTNRKMTLSRLCGNERNALILLVIFIISAYLNILIRVILKTLPPIYLLTLLSIPTAIILIKTMNTHIKNPDEEIKYNILMGSMRGENQAPKEQKNFIRKFLIMQNLLAFFIVLLCIAIISDGVINNVYH